MILTNSMVKKRINKYFKQVENADFYTCPCGCKQDMSWNSNQAEVMRKNILSMFEEK